MKLLVSPKVKKGDKRSTRIGVNVLNRHKNCPFIYISQAKTQNVIRRNCFSKQNLFSPTICHDTLSCAFYTPTLGTPANSTHETSISSIHRILVSYFYIVQLVRLSSATIYNSEYTYGRSRKDNFTVFLNSHLRTKQERMT